MTHPLQPGMLAHNDQLAALCNELLDEMVDSTRALLTTDEPALVLAMLAGTFAVTDKNRACSLAATALVRLAQMESPHA